MGSVLVGSFATGVGTGDGAVDATGGERRISAIFEMDFYDSDKVENKLSIVSSMIGPTLPSARAWSTEPLTRLTCLSSLILHTWRS